MFDFICPTDYSTMGGSLTKIYEIVQICLLTLAKVMVHLINQFCQFILIERLFLQQGLSDSIQSVPVFRQQFKRSVRCVRQESLDFLID